MTAHAHSFSVKVEALVRPLLAAENYDLVWVEHLSSANILRLYIDTLGQESGEGITLDDCTKVSHWVSDVLDSEGLSDALKGRFKLEVSSPGLDRPLVRPSDFARFIGREVKLNLNYGDVDAFPGRRRFKGILCEAAAEGAGQIQLEVEGLNVAIGYEQISMARLVPDY
jgi:ribosome maturation factor RimP